MTADYYSNYFEVDRLSNKQGTEVMHKLKSHFARHGIPDQVVSDNGPPFGAHDFKRSMDRYEIENLTSSPRYPRSNGKADNAVKTAKHIMTKALESNSEPYLALLDWRKTPSEWMESSPVQRLFGRRTKTLLPTASRVLDPGLVQGAHQKLMARKTKQSQYFNQGTRELVALESGETVHLRLPGGKKWRKATVEEQDDIRSYQVRTEDGRIFRRNREHLRAARDPPSTGVVYPVEEPLPFEPQGTETPTVSRDNPANRDQSSTAVSREPQVNSYESSLRRTSGRALLRLHHT